MNPQITQITQIERKHPELLALNLRPSAQSADQSLLSWRFRLGGLGVLAFIISNSRE
jgi:hypothetical protein